MPGRMKYRNAAGLVMALTVVLVGPVWSAEETKEQDRLQSQDQIQEQQQVKEQKQKQKQKGIESQTQEQKQQQIHKEQKGKNGGQSHAPGHSGGKGGR